MIASVLSSSWTVENLHVRLFFSMDVVEHKYRRSTVIDRSDQKTLYEDLNTMVWEWFCTVRSKNLPASGHLLQEKAPMLSVTMNHDYFTASNGWLESWQKQYGVKLGVLGGRGPWRCCWGLGRAVTRSMHWKTYSMLMKQDYATMPYPVVQWLSNLIHVKAWRQQRNGSLHWLQHQLHVKNWNH